MATVELNLPHHRYEIRIEPGALGRLGEWIKETVPHDRAALLADATVLETHGATAKRSLEKAGFELVVFAGGGGVDCSRVCDYGCDGKLWGE